jgi:hypothetical protein
LANLKLGFSLKLTGKGMMENLPVLYNLTPKDTYERFAESSWVKKMLQRRDYERNKNSENPWKWLPSRDHQCKPGYCDTHKCTDGFFRHQCWFGIADFRVLAKVGKKEWTNAEAFQFLSKYGAHKQAGTLWKNFNTYKESAFENIGLKMYFFMANNLGTPYFNRYDEKSASELSQPLSTKKIPGDGTVSLTSQLGPAMKWADEFDSKMPGAKPVKIVHYCDAIHQRAAGKYDSISDD